MFLLPRVRDSWINTQCAVIHRCKVANELQICRLPFSRSIKKVSGVGGAGQIHLEKL